MNKDLIDLNDLREITLSCLYNLREYKFNSPNLSLDKMNKIDNALNAITNLLPYLT